MEGMVYSERTGCSYGYQSLQNRKLLLFFDDSSTLEFLPVGPYPMFAQDSILEGFFISGRFITTRTMPGVSVAFDDFISRISTQIKFFHLPSAFQIADNIH
jgi:hypothetical protein